MSMLSNQLDDLKRRFLRELPDRLGRLMELMGSAITNDRAALEELQLCTHNLANAAAVFGYAGLSKKAKEFDLFLSVLLEGRESDAKSLPSQMWPFVRQFIGDLTKIHENISADSNISLEAETHIDDISLEPQTIVYCTSDRLVGETIATVLETFGHSVELIDPDDLAGRIDSADTDFILLSLILRGTDGRELAKEVRATHSSPYIPIVFITGHDDASTLTSCVAAGADDVIPIPFETQTLLTRMYALKRLINR